MLFVSFADSGTYSLSVYNPQGLHLASKTADVPSGGMMRLRLANAGVYVVNISKNGKTCRTLKLMRK